MVPQGCTAIFLRAQAFNIGSGGSAATITLLTGSNPNSLRDTNLSCSLSISSAGGSASCNNLQGAATFNTGDVIALRATINGVGAFTTGARFLVTFQCLQNVTF